MSYQDRVWDDIRFPNRVIELICEVYNENNFTLKNVIEVLILQTIAMNGMAFTPLVRNPHFKSWIYQIIKTQLTATP